MRKEVTINDTFEYFWYDISYPEVIIKLVSIIAGVNKCHCNKIRVSIIVNKMGDTSGYGTNITLPEPPELLVAVGEPLSLLSSTHL